MRRRKHTQFHEPSLVPLADMLTNTVGIVVFILIFTVLTAGGVVILKRLPIESRVQAQPLYFVCVNGRVLPLSTDLVKKFLEPIGKPTSYSQVGGWIKSFNAHRLEDEFFVITGQGKANYIGSSISLDVDLIFTPQAGKGETIEELKREDSRFRQILKNHNAKDNALQFIVFADSLDTFLAARSLAVNENYGLGWSPKGANQLLRVSLTGGGGGDGIIVL